MKTRVLNTFPRLEPPGVARIAIIGEAPGKNEEEQGQPFVGQSGQLLNAVLSQVGIVRDQCFVGNVVNFRPQSNDINSVDWNSEEVQSSIAQLREDLIKFRPSIILCLGNAALFLMKRGANPGPRKTRQKRKQEGGEDDFTSDVGELADPARASVIRHADGETETSTEERDTPSEDGSRPIAGSSPAVATTQQGSFLWPDKIGSWRGSLFESGWLELPEDDSTASGWDSDGPRTIPVKCLATFHPAAVLRDFSLQFYFKADIKRVAQESKTRELELPKRSICIHKENAEGVCALLRWFRENKEPIGVDTEGFCGRLECFSLAIDSYRGHAFPLEHTDGTSVWSEDDEVKILEAFKGLMEDPEVPKILQNSLFDSFVLAWGYGIVIRNVAHDTMLLWWELFCELEKKLAVQTSILTKEPFYKDERTDEADEVAWTYAAKDAVVTFECWERMMAMITPEQYAHYTFNVSLLVPLIFMQMRGMKWASDEASIAREEALRKAYEMQARIDEEAMLKGPELNELQVIRGGDEKLFAAVVAQQLCQKSIKRSVEIVEERWQPVKWNGKKWVKDGKQIEKLPAILQFCVLNPQGPPVLEGQQGYVSKFKTKTINQPFSPSTLAECEEFVLESKRGEWERVKEIWKELTNENNEQESLPAVSQDRDAFSVSRGDKIHAETESSSGLPVVGGHCVSKLQETNTKAHLLGELSTLLSLAINVGSTQADGDAQRFLYEICQLDPQFKKIKGKRTDKISSDQNALVKLYSDTQDVRVLWVLQLRRLRKLATDLATEVDNDGRIRSTFSLVKETGRMSASESPTNTGTNLQALNKDLRFLCKADDGCVFRQKDLKGADSWTVAAECAALGDNTMLLDLQAGMRPAEILALIVRRGPSVNSLERSLLQSEIDADKPSWPYWLYPGTKAGMHLTCYAGKVPTLIQTLLRNSLKELPLDLSTAKPIVLTFSQGEAIQRAVHTRYPGIAKWHQKSAAILMKDGVLRTSAGHVRRFYGRKKEFKNGQWTVNYDTLKEFLASLPQYNTTLSAKLALHNIWYDPENNTGDCLRYRPCFVVHDSILGECREEDSAWAGSKEKLWFGSSINIAGIEVVIPSSLEVWRHWGMKD